MIFTLHTHSLKTGLPGKLFYDNMTSTLLDENGNEIDLGKPDRSRAFAPAPLMPAKASAIKKLKISLGLSCNYSCEYCSQRFVPRAEETNPHDVGNFMANLPSWFDGGEDGLGKGVRIEFWGGEPLVYIKTLKPLAEKLRVNYPRAEFLLITNGSLLNAEINEWIDKMGFNVGLSHDGPGQGTRGPDPLLDPKSRAAIIDLYRRLHPQGRMSINTMLHLGNMSKAAIAEHHERVFGPDVLIGQGEIVDPYDEGGMSQSIPTSMRGEFVRNALTEMAMGKTAGFMGDGRRLVSFIESMRDHKPADSIGQKCGMDRAENIAVNLHGDVLTCQNVSIAGTAPNGQSHKIGHVTNLAAATPAQTSTHWSQRAGCKSCPVLQLCHGGCMFLQGNLWKQGCDNAYTDNIVYFIAAIEMVTGQTVFQIDGGDLPAERSRPLDDHGRKVIPIMPI